MLFTQDDYIKIREWLARNSIKDTEFNEAIMPFKGNETIAFVQDGHNVKVYLKDFINQLSLLGVHDFINITEASGESHTSLEDAIKLVPYKARKSGQVITFLNTEGNWKIYQFKGVLNQWNQLDLWEDLFDWEKLIINSILPDEEDLTKSPADENGNSYLSLKDREYEPNNYSGLGRIILRKNIIGVEDPIYGKVKKNVLYQDMINKLNTIYEIRYDFDLNGEEINIPEGCVLDFQGGSLNNGTIIGNETIIQDTLSKIFGLDIIIQGSFKLDFARPEWFGIDNNDNTDAIQKVVSSFIIVKFLPKEYRISSTINVTKAKIILGTTKTPHNYSCTIIKVLGDCLTALKLSKDLIYSTIDGIYITGPDSTIAGDVYKIGTTAIDMTENVNINFINGAIQQFEKGIVSNFNSYYNHIENNYFQYVGTCMLNFSPNNFIIERNRFRRFGTAISKLSGDGNMTVAKNSFEEFTHFIMSTSHPARNISFERNYVEPTRKEVHPPLTSQNNGMYGGNILFSGEIHNFVVIGNEFQINDSYRLMYLTNPCNLVFIGNKYNIDINSTNLNRLLYLMYSGDNTLLKLIWLDSVVNINAGGVYTSNYNGTNIIEGTEKTITIGTEPILNSDLKSKFTAPGIFANSIYFSADDSYFGRCIKYGNKYTLRGRIIKKGSSQLSSGTVVATTPPLDLVIIRTSYPYCMVRCFDSSGNNIILKYTFSTQELTYISGTINGEIIFDGAEIIPPP